MEKDQGGRMGDEGPVKAQDVRGNVASCPETDEESRGRIIRDITKYSVANYASALLTFAGHILYRRYLSPEEYGVWEVLLVVLGYVTAAELGLTNGMSRELPFYLGKMDMERARRVEDSVFTAVLLITAFLSLLLLSASFFLSDYPREVVWGLRFLSAIVIFTQVQNIYLTLLRSYRDFSLLSRLRVLTPFLTIILSLAFVWKFALFGMFLGSLVSAAFILLYTVKKTGRLPRPQLSKGVLRPVFNVGVAMFAWSYMSGIFLTMDRLLIAKFLGVASLGYYSVATMVQSAMTNFPRSVSTNMYPRIVAAYGRNEDARDTLNYVVKPAEVLACLSSVMMGVAFFTIQIPVEYILPDYMPGIQAAKILVVGTSFLALRYTFEHLLIASRKLLQLTLLVLPPSVLMASLSYLFLKSGYGIDGVAFAMSASFFFYTVLLITYSHGLFSRGASGLKLVATLLLPYSYTLGLVYVIEKALDAYPYGIYQVLVKTGLLLLLSTPLLYYAGTRAGLIPGIQAGRA